MFRGEFSQFTATTQLAVPTYTPSVVNNTVFFDIDSTLCCLDNQNDQKFLKLEILDNDYYMLLHFKFLFDYLMSHNCEIAFFSAGIKNRNDELLDKYMSHDRMYGRGKYEQLKAEGQFKVFGKHQLVADDLDYFSWGLKPLQDTMPNKSFDTVGG